VKTLIAATLACSLSAAAVNTGAREKNLDQCRSIQAELNRLEALRRGGGSAKQMDSWKRRMHDKQDDYSRLYCRRYRHLID
jgi:hypothetical protein